MPGPSLFLGRELVLFVAAESSFGVAAQGYPQAAEACRVTEVSVEIGAPLEMRPDKFGTSTDIGKIDQHRTAAWEASMLLLPAGVSTEPDITDLLSKGGWQVVKPGTPLVTTVVAAGSTATTIKLASVSGLAAGHGMSFQMTAAGGREVRRITAVDGGAGSVTVSPPLTAVPTDGYSAKSCIVYAPKDARADVPDSTTLFVADNRSLDIVRGAMPESYSVEMGGDTAARLVVTGRGRRGDRLVSTLLNGGINDVVTSIVVDSGTAAPSDVTTYWQIDSEIVAVTATSGTTWTVTRGALSSSAAAHSNNAEIYPYTPTGTFAGSPVPATAGDAFFGTAPTPLQVQSARVEIGMPVAAVEDEMGDTYKVATYAVAQRKINVSVRGACRYDTWGKLQTDGIQRESTILHLQQGDEEGKIVAVTLPAVRLAGPRVARGGASEYVEVDLSGQAEGTTAGEDEVFLILA